MLTGFEVYLITAADRVSSVSQVIFFASAIIGVVSVFSLVILLSIMYDAGKDRLVCVSEQTRYANARSVLKYPLLGLCLFPLAAFLYCITPTTRDLALVYVVPKITNSEFVCEQLPKDLQDIYALAKQRVVDELTEGRGNSNNEEGKK